MSATIHDPTLFEHDNLIRLLHRGQAMGNHQNRAIGHGLLQAQLHRRLGLSIQGAGRFIQQQDRGIPQDRASDRDALQLTTGKIAAPFLKLRVVAIG